MTTTRRLTIAAILSIVHSLIGVVMWTWLIYCQTVLVSRIVAPDKFRAAIVEWFPFFARSWRSVVPLCLSVAAICLVRRRPTLSFQILVIVAVATAAVAGYDIATQNANMSTFGPSHPRTYHYLSWWWCHHYPL